MERRRYIPTSVGLELEQRQLLSTASPSILGGSTTKQPIASDLAANLAQRLQRIDHLPGIMESFQPGRTIPKAVIVPIQDDLRGIISKLRDAPAPVLNQFNQSIRSVIQTKNVLPADGQSLLRAFDAVLKGSGADDATRAKFQVDMKNLVRLAAAGVEPSIQAANDFGVIAQLVQAVGHPFAAPSAPGLAPTEKINKTNATNHANPTFTGTATLDSTILIALKDNGGIIAGGTTSANGTYTVKSTVSLPAGKYVVQALTYDSGYYSLPSRPYTFRVVASTPKGPRA